MSQAGTHHVFLNVGGTTLAARGSAIDLTHELLDSQSTINIFSNGKLLRHIQRVPHYITVYSHAGSSRTNLVGFRDGHGWVWYDPHGIGNIYSMKLMTKHYRVTFDSQGIGAGHNAFVVHHPDGPMRFATDNRGLYFRAVHNGPEALVLTTTTTRDGVWTSAASAEGLTRAEVRWASEARCLQQMLGYPSDRDYDGMVRGHMLRDCCVVTADIANACAVYGPNRDALRGKITWRSPHPTVSNYVDAPWLIRDRCRDIDISADLFFINKVAFFVTRSRRLQFATAIVTTGVTKPHLVDNLDQVVKLYKCFGFRVRTCFADGQFECLRNEVEGVHIDTSSHDRHIGDIERLIRVIKERVRSLRAGLPFRRLPRRVIIEAVTFVMFWLNSFPARGGVSCIYSPRTIIMGTTVSQRLHCRLPFSSYAEVHDNPSLLNLTNVNRTTPALCLGPTGNERGTYWFFSLMTGAVLRRYQWEELPITPTVVNRVHEMALYDNQADGLALHDRTGTLMEQVSHEHFDTLASPHYPATLNRPGVALARDMPPTDGEGRLATIPEEAAEDPSGADHGAAAPVDDDDGDTVAAATPSDDQSAGPTAMDEDGAAGDVNGVAAPATDAGVNAATTDEDTANERCTATAATRHAGPVTCH
jgi:hypothetical protein